MLTDVGRKLDKADSQACGLVANYLRKHGQLAYAREMYKKTGDFKSVVTLYVRKHFYIYTTMLCPIFILLLGLSLYF